MIVYTKPENRTGLRIVSKSSHNKKRFTWYSRLSVRIDKAIYWLGEKIL
ncbi:MAG: hypothetical protein U9Q66_00440 [Patescibacteria group bacterium]|nr:hypothetical protein [Patescibacteria group bacterium]